MRGALAAIGGYISMFIVVFVCLTVAYLAVGTEGSFQPGSFEPSMLWIGIMIVVGLVAAILGGIVCAKIGRGKGVKGLIGIVVVLSALQIVMQLASDPPEGKPETRPAEMSGWDAMQFAEQPLWFSILNPILAIVGIGIGTRKAGKE